MHTTNENKGNNSSMDDIVFEDRNKSYGAYQLRKSYLKNFVLAMVIATAVLVLPILLFSFISNPQKLEDEMGPVIEIEELSTEKKEEITKPKTQKVKSEQNRSSILEIKDKVIEEDTLPIVDALDKSSGFENTNDETNKIIVEEKLANNKLVDVDSDEAPYASVEEPAEFPGGRVAMMKFISDNIYYPQNAKRRAVQGRIFIYFEIDKTGKVVNSRCIKGIEKECDEEALRVVKSFPDWKPAKINGRKVKQQIKLPINFVIID